METQKSHLEKTLESFEEEDWFNLLLRYSLFLGAIFQMACIAACIFLSDPDGEALAPEIRSRECDENSANKRLHHKQRRQEKKKRR